MADEESEHVASEAAKGAPANRERAADPDVIDGEVASQSEPSTAPSEKTSAAADLRSPPPRSRGGAIRAFFAGVLGGLIVAAAALGGVYLYPPKAELAEADANRLAAMETQTQRAEAHANRLAAVEAQAKDAAASAKAQLQRQSDVVAGLDKRIAALESSSSASGAAALAGRTAALEAENTVRMAKVAAAEDAAKQAAAEVKDLRSDAEAAAKAIPALQSRIAKLEASIAGQKQALAERAKAEDNVAAVGIVAEALRDKLRTGAPYGAELAALDRLGVDAAKLEPLKVLVNGAPTGRALAASFEAVAPKALAAASPPDDKSGGALDRFMAHVRGLVQVRNLTETPGDDPAALVSQIEAASGSGDFGAALAAYAKLPEPARKAAAGWAAQASARQAADAALQSIREAAIGRLVGGDKS
ncbi:MAG TPA: hypothetical protein VMI72_10350 [Roseiarcus sp.]|nr:hypothetical protein [Roseiarcus sp.]